MGIQKDTDRDKVAPSSVQPRLGHSRVPGVATAFLGIPSQPLTPSRGTIPSQSPVHRCPLAAGSHPRVLALNAAHFAPGGIQLPQVMFHLPAGRGKSLSSVRNLPWAARFQREHGRSTHSWGVFWGQRQSPALPPCPGAAPASLRGALAHSRFDLF